MRMPPAIAMFLIAAAPVAVIRRQRRSRLPALRIDPTPADFEPPVTANETCAPGPKGVHALTRVYEELKIGWRQ